MSQLVGQECTRCAERIKTVHDGTLCTACGCPIHVKCMTPRGSGCGACGTDVEVAAAYRKNAAARNEARDRELRSHHRGWGLAYILCGIGLIAAAVAVLAFSAFRVRVAMWGAAFAGLALIGRGVSRLVRGRP